MRFRVGAPMTLGMVVRHVKHYGPQHAESGENQNGKSKDEPG